MHDNLPNLLSSGARLQKNAAIQQAQMFWFRDSLHLHGPLHHVIVLTEQNHQCVQHKGHTTVFCLFLFIFFVYRCNISIDFWG